MILFEDEERNVDQLIVPDKGPQDRYEGAKAKNKETSGPSYMTTYYMILREPLKTTFRTL